MYDRQFIDLPAEVGYYSWYSLNFQIAVAAWWVGRREDSIELLTNTATDHRAPKLYRDAANENLDRLVPNVDV
jgi:hypothetical protein